MTAQGNYQTLDNLAERAERLIPAGTQTFSKARSQLPANAPSHIVSGRGAHVWGSDGREYVDWTMGLGAISLGYDDPRVTAAATRMVSQGTIFGLAHPIEVELAEAIVELLPWQDAQVRYGKNGSDATAGAVRAARALTGRDLVLSSGYHGWQDWCCPNHSGIPPSVRTLTKQVDDWREARTYSEYACVIVEPDSCPDLEGLRAWCDETETLLIFDEVLTGFRIDLRGAMHYYGVTPDLVCFAKAIANGYPLSVIAGPERYMKAFAGEVGYSFTFGGETVSIAAALATIRVMQSEPVIKKLWSVGRQIEKTWNYAQAGLGLEMPMVGLSPRLTVRYPSLAHRTLVSQEMIRRGVFWTVGATACYAHTGADIAWTCAAIQEVLELVATERDHPERLVDGPIVSHPFRRMTP